MGHFSFSEYIINKNNLLHNVKKIKSGLKPGVKFCAVVKADAYGVGANVVSKILEEEVDHFAVANVEEGIELRKSGIIKPITILGAINFDAINEYSLYNLRLTVNNFFEMSKLSRSVSKPTMVEFGLNTGMNRYGFRENYEILEALAIINSNFNLRVVGAYSHFSTKENDIEFMNEQNKKYKKFLEVLKFDKNLTFHLANTNAAINHKDFNYNMVRCGFGLYGMGEEELGLEPVVEIKSKIVSINKIEQDESVGYDRTYKANSTKLIGVVPLGYYDGINRRVSNKGKVLVNGKFAKVVGRVCMDAFMIDITDITNVQVGSEVVIIGKSEGKKITLANYARWSGTSEYETLTRLNKQRMREVVKI